MFFASITAFMGFGLVDPILPVIATQLNAVPSQVNLLFTSYNAVMAVAALITGVFSKKLGIKKTLLIATFFIAVFSSICGLMEEVTGIILLRCFWGFGNALFIATALTAIINYSPNDTKKSIILYEASIGVGFSVGPLIGGLLGQYSWKYPFFAVGFMMLIGFTLILILIPINSSKDKNFGKSDRDNISLKDPFKAIAKYPHIRDCGIIAFFYNFAFFTLFAYSPYVMNLDAVGIGVVFLFWGILVAVSSIFIAPKLQKNFNAIRTMIYVLVIFIILLFVMSVFADNNMVIIVCTIFSGIIIGLNNTLMTTIVMGSSSIDKPTTSASYNFLRFIGAAVAPYIAGVLGESISIHVPFLLGAIILIFGFTYMIIRNNSIRGN